MYSDITHNIVFCANLSPFCSNIFCTSSLALVYPLFGTGFLPVSPMLSVFGQGLLLQPFTSFEVIVPPFLWSPVKQSLHQNDRFHRMFLAIGVLTYYIIARHWGITDSVTLLFHFKYGHCQVWGVLILFAME